jgi:hypothetical protein
MLGYIIFILIMSVLSFLLGYFLKTLFLQKKYQDLEFEIREKELEAERKVLDIIEDGKRKRDEIVSEGYQEIKIKEDDCLLQKRQLLEQEDRVNQ